MASDSHSLASEYDPLANGPAETSPSNGPVVPANALEALRARRDAIGQAVEKDFPLPGYAGMLVARYRRLEFAEARKALMARAKPGVPMTAEDELAGQVQVLAKACVGVYLGGGDLIQISPNYGPELLEALALNLPRTTAADVIHAVFNNDMSIPAHHARVMNWMQGTDADVAEEFTGE